MDKLTNRWRLLLLLLVAVSILSLAAIVWIERQPLGFVRELRAEIHAASPEGDNSAYEPPPAVVSALSALFTLAIGGIFVLYLFPTSIQRMSRALSISLKGLLRLTGLGLLSIVIAGVIGVSAAFSTSVFPVTIALAAILILGSYLGIIAMSYTLGRILLNRAGWPHLSPVYALLLGVFILYPFAELPYVGIIFKILFASLGAGAVVATRFGSGKLWNLEPLLEDNNL